MLSVILQSGTDIRYVLVFSHVQLALIGASSPTSKLIKHADPVIGDIYESIFLLTHC
jgi:hypothetical protein